ncbi:hypothetical protein [Conexibacter sp. DBS9H8]|uniref:hypothetical protein n=1 Tax=Conexibacter sp. DBS9H8 TaxID=2937801 RepID=UPI00200CAFED|nr:hypothetical protein [Conexibacter sp. DBS9H8]
MSSTVTPQSFAQSLLSQLNLPTTTQNLKIIVGWEKAEGGAGPQFGVPNNVAAYNPLNSTQPMPGSVSTPGPGVQAYVNWAQGLQATIQTLGNGNYAAILSMLQGGNAPSSVAAQVIDSSVWGTKDLTAALIDGAAVTPNDPGQIITGTLGGGIFGLGGTGTAANQTSPSIWVVGNSQNPDMDYWTCLNEKAQQAQWYLISDGETLYAADGIKLMGQTPTAVIVLYDPHVISANLTYDNCLALDTPVPTPTGWTTMGEIKLGDQVYGSHGAPTRVIGVSAVHHGHACYRVSFSDQTSVIADDGHLWETISASGRAVVTTEQIRRSLSDVHRVGAVTVEAVEQVASVPVRCIQVDAPDSLYLVGEGMVPTHNTAFQSTHTTLKREGVVRRATLARVTSPTECEIEIICPIDTFRAGDTVQLLQFGQAADGVWLVGEARRSAFQIYTTLTLVQAMQPLNANTGLNLGPGYEPGNIAAKPGSNTVLAAIIAEANAISNAKIPYVWGGGHANAGTPSGSPLQGFDCSGAVGAVLYAAGIWPPPNYKGTSVPIANQIVTDLLNAGGILAPGPGTGKYQVTIYDRPTHIYLNIDGEFWQFGGPEGVPGGWWPSGTALPDFRVTHILPSVLGQVATPVTGVVG